jgi:undecaprenyl diphosphate synthase
MSAPDEILVTSPPREAVAKRVAIIMDGNGRWASGHGLPVSEGHRAGTRAGPPDRRAAIDLGIESLTVYAFSTENWTRPATRSAR